MSKEIIKNIKLTNEGTIKSTELVEIINAFRKEESELTKGKYTELKHKHFIAKIKKELEVMKKCGINGETNICPGYYNDKQNQKRPCFELNRDGMLQMLNSESTIVRCKTIQYINELENKNKQLLEDNKQLTEIAESDKDREERIRKANIINYSVNNIEQRLLECDYTNIESTVKKIIDIHKNMYVNERYKAHQDTNKYGNRGSAAYINHIKEIIENKLDKIRPQMNIINPNINAIIIEIARRLHKEIEASKNITDGRMIGKLSKQAEEALKKVQQKQQDLLELKEKYDPTKFWTIVNCHPFSVNSMYKDNHITDAYDRWINNFPKDRLHSKEEYENKVGVDFNKPIVIYLKYKNLPKFDTDNLSKSFIDYIFNRHFLVDDKIVKGKIEYTKEHCNKFEDGQVMFTLRNMTEEEIERLNNRK